MTSCRVDETKKGEEWGLRVVEGGGGFYLSYVAEKVLEYAYWVDREECLFWVGGRHWY